MVIGKVIQALEQALRQAFLLEVRSSKLEPRSSNLELRTSRKRFRLAGVVLVFLVVGGSYAATLFILKLLYFFHPWAALGGEIWLISTTIATQGLARSAYRVLIPLKQGDLAAARHQISQIVGRDTHHMDEKDITRATIETVAENIVDGVISPLFYACLGGAPLAMAYRAVNTLDSMVGYRNEKYYAFGWAAARLDDLANYIPARLTGLVLVLAAWFSGLRSGSGKAGCLRYKFALHRAGEAWRIMRRDSRRHPSLNSGIPEAAVAGALRIQLGGLNYYQGKPEERARLGDAVEPLEIRHAVQTVKLLYLSTGLFVIFIGLIYLGWRLMTF